jgi:hypothetical protein
MTASTIQIKERIIKGQIRGLSKISGARFETKRGSSRARSKSYQRTLLCVTLTA